MKIDLVFNDIDGCFGNFTKPKTYPSKQSLKGHMRIMSGIRRFAESRDDVKFSACTGRSLYLCDNIIEASGMNELSAVEMGQAIYNPITRESYGLLEIIKPELKGLGAAIRDFIKETDSFETELKAAFKGSRIKRLKDNINMLTYEFKSKKDGGITGEEVYAFLEPRLPKEVSGGIAKGDLKVIISSAAIDLRPDINKGHAIDHILARLDRSGEGCLGIGDSYHSDIDMLTRCEYVACPANSNEQLKEYVASKKGYIARKPFGEGVLEIYNMLI